MSIGRWLLHFQVHIICQLRIIINTFSYRSKIVTSKARHQSRMIIWPLYLQLNFLLAIQFRKNKIWSEKESKLQLEDNLSWKYVSTLLCDLTYKWWDLYLDRNIIIIKNKIITYIFNNRSYKIRYRSKRSIYFLHPRTCQEGVSYMIFVLFCVRSR